MGDWTVNGGLIVNDTTHINTGIIGAQHSSASTYEAIKNLIVPLQGMSYDTLGVSAGVDNFFPAWVKKICEVYPGYKTCTFVGAVTPDYTGFAFVNIYSTNDVNSSGFPNYCSGEYIGASSGRNGRYSFGTTGYSWHSESNRYVDKTATVSFAAGTIGTRAYTAEWATSAIGGDPIRAEIISVGNSASIIPIVWSESTKVYFRAYRAVSTAVSDLDVKVRIYYK